MSKEIEIKKVSNLHKAFMKAKHEVSGEEMLTLAQSFMWLHQKLDELSKPDMEILDGKDSGVTKREVSSDPKPGPKKRSSGKRSKPITGKVR